MKKLLAFEHGLSEHFRRKYKRALSLVPHAYLQGFEHGKAAAIFAVRNHPGNGKRKDLIKRIERQQPPRVQKLPPYAYCEVFHEE